MKRHGIALALVLQVSTLEAAPASPTKSLARSPYVGAISIDADTGQALAEHNPDRIAYPASVVKLMTLYLVLEKIQKGELRLDDPVTVTAEASRTGEASVYLKDGEVFPVEELLYAIMLRSANDAATALAIHIAGSVDVFVELMNRTANELGMRSTLYRTPHGLPPSPDERPPRPPDITTARDVSRLSIALLRQPDALRFTSTTARNFRPGPHMVRMKNHNPLLGEVPGCDGLKTGWFRKAGYSISATVKRNDRRIVVVVLGSKTKEERNDSAKALITRAFATLPPLPPPPPPTPVEAPQASTQPAHEKWINAPWIYGAGGLVVLAILVGIVRVVRQTSHNRDF